jgi:hypothetical protein
LLASCRCAPSTEPDEEEDGEEDEGDGKEDDGDDEYEDDDGYSE